MKRIPIRIIAIIISILILVSCITGFLLAYLPTQMSAAHTDKIVKLYFEDTGYSPSVFYEDWEPVMENFELTASLGHSIPVTYFCPNDSYVNKTIILVHWHEANQKVMLPIAEEFLKMGWNVVLYDQRAHGKNTAKTVTFGYLESKDLQDVVDFVYEKTEGSTLGTLGQSMGAATIAYYTGTEHAGQHLDFAIVDSAFSGMYEEIDWEISKLHLPIPSDMITKLGSSFCKFIYGYGFSEISISEQIHNNNIPTLILHSKKDNKCPYDMGVELYDRIIHKDKQLITFQSSEHLFSFWEEKELYMQSVFKFIEQ